MATTAAWQTSRTYQDPDGRGRRLNVVSAAARLEMAPRKFWRYQLRGWHQWQDENCQPLHLESLRMTPEGGQSEETYLESQVLELRDAMQSSPEERYQKMGRVNREMIAQRLGMQKRSAQGNGNFGEWEKAGKLTPTFTRSPITGKREKTYPASQVDSLREERNALTRDVLHRDEKDYLSTAEVCRRLGVTDQAIRWWTNGGITPLGGEEWDRIETPTLHGGKACWYEVGQVERIRVALQSWRTARLERRACSETEIHVIDGESYLTPTAIQEGRGLTERVAWSALKRLVEQGRVKSERVRGRTKGGKPGQFVYHQQQIQAYLDERAIVFDGVFETAKGRAFGLTRATQELKARWHFNCSRWFLEQQIIKSPYLPEGKLPSLQLVPPSQHASWCGRELTAVLERDLANLVATIKGAVEAGNRVDPNWLDAVDIARVFGFVRNKERQFGSLLKRWRESGELTNVHRVWWDRRGKRARVRVLRSRRGALGWYRFGDNRREIGI